MGPGKKHYKSYELYCCFALNRLASELDINIYQDGIEEKLDEILVRQKGLSKRDIKYEIKSNNYMTNRVLERLVKQGMIKMERLEDRYNIKITKLGIIHVKKFNEYYWQMFSDHITEHYRFKNVPLWFEKLK